MPPIDDDAGDEGGAPMCTAIRNEPAGASSPADTDASPEDDAVQTLFLPDSVLESEAFVLGVQSGSVTPTSAVLWVKATPETEPTVRVWRESETVGNVLLAFEAVATVGEGDTVRIEATDLAPNTIYQYAFFTKSGEDFTGRSSIGRFRTAPAPGDLVSLRIGTTTCVGADDEADYARLVPFAALSLMGEERPDVILHLGDETYNDGAVTVAQYRESWSRTLGEQGYRDLLSSSSMYGTWDDHEVEDNWNDPAKGVTEERVANARQVYDEYSATLRASDDPIWASYQWGDTAEFIVLDARSERVWDSQGTPDAQFISDEQLAFFKDRLQNSTAHFKIVLTSVNMTNLPTEPGWDIPVGFTDRWEGYGAQREEVLDFIVDNNIDNVWFLAGDIHMGFVGRLEPEGHPYSRMWEITVGPGASGVNPIAAGVELGLIDQEVAFPCNQFVFGHGRTQVATFLELDPGADTVHVKFVDALTDEVLFDEVMRQDEE